MEHGRQICSGRYYPHEKTSPVRESRVGGTARGGGFSPEMYRVRASDHGAEKARGEEYETDYKKGREGVS